MDQLGKVLSKAELNAASSKNVDKLIVLYFRADWAPQCKQVDDLIPDLVQDKELSHAVFCRVEAEEAQELCAKFGIESVPTFVVLLKGDSVAKVEGVDMVNLVQKVKDLKIKLELSTPITATGQETMNKLKEITNRAQCVLLLEGTPEEPVGEHNRGAVEVLKRLQVPFSSFNVNGDPAFRDQLLSRIAAPAPVSYPLLFVNNILVGGIDKIKTLSQTGELEKLLPKTKSLTERLDELINAAPVMVFMKGTPESPCCGFSRTLVEIFRKTGVTYKSFNILADEEVRQGLKKHSNWPTYPQIYAKGSLVGGLDIIKELEEAGELKSTLQG
uniref:Putative glutaredoxin-related protein n=1 Tax=Ornithodoros turicata TaxID=34597 RepID=A0A2R5LED4_9ACAR